MSCATDSLASARSCSIGTASCERRSPRAANCDATVLASSCDMRSYAPTSGCAASRLSSRRSSATAPSSHTNTHTISVHATNSTSMNSSPPQKPSMMRPSIISTRLKITW